VTAAAGRIGPNAVTRLAEAITALDGAAEAEDVFAAAGLSRHLAQPPTAMVRDEEVAALHTALRARAGEAHAARIAWDAGARTAAYLLAHRVPRPFGWLTRALPPAWAARLLLALIGRHAWTFAGAGHFAVLPEAAPCAVAFTITDGPVARGARSQQPACAYYAATFEGLFQALVHPRARVTETECSALGAPSCCFRAHWPAERS
jgi:divinyl protochlorophyllide a 8-vinyl-reductase